MYLLLTVQSCCTVLMIPTHAPRGPKPQLPPILILCLRNCCEGVPACCCSASCFQSRNGAVVATACTCCRLSGARAGKPLMAITASCCCALACIPGCFLQPLNHCDVRMAMECMGMHNSQRDCSGTGTQRRLGAGQSHRPTTARVPRHAQRWRCDDERVPEQSVELVQQHDTAASAPCATQQHAQYALAFF